MEIVEKVRIKVANGKLEICIPGMPVAYRDLEPGVTEAQAIEQFSAELRSYGFGIFADDEGKN
jgi:hypothetical protein